MFLPCMHTVVYYAFPARNSAKPGERKAAAADYGLLRAACTHFQNIMLFSLHAWLVTYGRLLFTHLQSICDKREEEGEYG